MLPTSAPSYSPSKAPSVPPTMLPSSSVPSFSPSNTPSSNYPSSSPSIGIITTIAGSSTSGSYSGDNGQATAATLNTPYGVDVDAAGE